MTVNRTGKAPEVLTAHLNVERVAPRLLWVCLATEAVLFLLDYFINYSEWTHVGAIRRMFNTTREDGLASWFGVTQTLLAGLTLSGIWFCAKASRRDKWVIRGWAILSVFFLYMAVDDGAQIHERVGTAVKAMGGGSSSEASFFPSYTWQLVFVPAFGLVGLFMLWFLWQQIRDRTGRTILLIAIAFQVGAVGLDFQEGLAPDHPLNVYTAIAERFDYASFADEHFGENEFDTVLHFSQSFEETIEMAAISLLWSLFVRQLRDEPGAVRLRFLEERPS